MDNIFNNTRVLITGGAGAIGSQLAKRLIGYNCKITVIDDLSSGRVENIPIGVDFIKADISKDLSDISTEFDYIFHCAGFFANQNSVLHPKRDLDVNGIGTLNVLEFANRQVALVSMVYLSSSCVYGPQGGTLVEDKISGKFDTPYALTKFLGEGYCDFFYKYHKLPVSTIRLFNSYGPGEFPGEFRNVIPNFIYKAMNGNPLVITGTGDETRNFTYVEDVIDGMLRVASSKVAGETINLGTGKEITIKYLAELINEITGNKSGIEFIQRRKWDNILKRNASIEKAKTLLGFESKTSIEEGLQKTYNWLKNVI
ncbi:MAG: NAD-dependent epimerase/dehydratase family protein [Clostridia bacterium]|nr:NAD-dependent epimerase/dehydratase family protein [Clostridia bacterium]